MSPPPYIAGRPACLLIVNDESDNRELLDVILGWEGFTTVSAANGEDAIAAVAQERPHLILLDLMMPGMDGYEVATKLKSELASKGTPIIIVSAMTDESSRAHGKKCGAEDFIAKPVDRDQLMLQVKRLLRETYPDYEER